MIRCSRRGADLARSLLFVALVLPLPFLGTGCEEDTKPYITKLSANPLCGAMTVQEPDSTLGLEVSFFARASSGNRFDDPTGANSALDWFWDFDGDGRVDAENVVEPRFVYDRVGDYEASLTVQDDDGDTDTRTLLVQVRGRSNELDILDFEAEVRTGLRFDESLPENTGLDPEGEERPIEVIPLRDRVVLSTQPEFEGWQATFDGILRPTCEITDIFAQYDWEWGFDTGDVRPDQNPVTLSFDVDQRGDVSGVVSVTEVVTGVRRTDTITSTLPVGGALTNPVFAYVAPGAPDSIDVRGYYLDGANEVSVRIEYDPGLTLDRVELNSPLIDQGFSGTSETEENFVDIRFESDTALDDPSAEIQIARLYFTNAPDTLSVPQIRPIRLREFTAVRDTTVAPTSTRDAFLVHDVADCNGNRLGDTMELLARESFVDRSGDGVLDYCADCNDNGRKDGAEIADEATVDIDINGIPDECDCNSDGEYDELQLASGDVDDEDQNNLPDDCDCDWNGVADLVEIRQDPSFELVLWRNLPQDQQDLVTVPHNEAFGYTSDLDQFAGESNGVLDFCEDCDDNGVLDFLQYTVGLPPEDGGFDPDRRRVDVDANGVLDECDCNGNGRFDRGEIERGFVTASDGELIDDCDCNDNQTADLVDIGDAITEVENRDGTIVYTSTLDANRDQVIDACADCNENGTPDGDDFAAGGPLLDVDSNGLLDECDCNSDEIYDPPLDPTTNDLDQNGVFDLCDCDRNAVPDLDQIADAITDFTVGPDGRLASYVSEEDQITLIDFNEEDSGDFIPLELEAGPDQIPDLCQDCNANGVPDRNETFEDIENLGPNRSDLDRDGLLDECDCNLNGDFDVVEITLDPALDGDGDEVIDDCDCNENGRLDIVEIQEFAIFDQATGIYLRAEGTNDLGQDIIDANGNGVLDQCEEQAAADQLLAPINGRVVGSDR
ncbi:MAG TPA: PKD domain-containing protein [Candidatus Krumholzibacteria bacterium]|nr:PKD domain-containing protein [Candidatus Krumholzibacteria bacterium]